MTKYIKKVLLDDSWETGMKCVFYVNAEITLFRVRTMSPPSSSTLPHTHIYFLNKGKLPWFPSSPALREEVVPVFSTDSRFFFPFSWPSGRQHCHPVHDQQSRARSDGQTVDQAICHIGTCCLPPCRTCASTFTKCINSPTHPSGPRFLFSYFY